MRQVRIYFLSVQDGRVLALRLMQRETRARRVVRYHTSVYFSKNIIKLAPFMIGVKGLVPLVSRAE